MKEHFTNLRATRKLLASVTQDLSIEQLNKIPNGFNNNIAWNMGHILVTQQLLIYSLTGTKPYVSNELISQFRKGTAPEKQVTAEQLNEITTLLESTVEQFIEDFQNEAFGPFKEYPTSYGVVLHSLEEAIIFNNMHEALHLGYILAMKRTVER